MSNLISRPTPIEGRGRSSPIPILEIYPARPAKLGKGLTVYRALPRRHRRLVGAWCFLDYFGPLATNNGVNFDVPPHPHIGLQTVTWLFQGEVIHKDSLNSEQSIRAGELNLMTSGRGIVHSEEASRSTSPLHGVQLWTALPDAHRRMNPTFHHYAALPEVSFGVCRVLVFMGKFGNMHSPAETFSPIVGAELTATADGKADLHFEPDFEYALFLVNGRGLLQDVVMQPKTLYYLGAGRMGVNLELDSGTRLLVLGGVPLEEKIVMWWNFVARTSDEILNARESWERQEFGRVASYAGRPMAAPPFQIRVKPPSRQA